MMNLLIIRPQQTPIRISWFYHVKIGIMYYDLIDWWV